MGQTHDIGFRDQGVEMKERCSTVATRRAWFAVALLAVATCGAYAQDRRSGAHSESEQAGRAPPALRAAVRAVWAVHPEVAAARHRRDAERARAVAAGRPLYNPELELGVEHADDDTVEAGLSLAIDWSGKRRARAAAGAAQARAAEAMYVVTRNQVATEWLAAWATWRVAEARLDLGQQRVAVMRRFADLAERQLRVGDISRLERDLAVLALGEAQAEQADLITEQAAAARTLRSGYEGAFELAALPWLPESPPDAPLVSPEAIETLAGVRQAQIETEAADARVMVAERDRRPDPTVALRSGRVDLGPTTEPLLGLSVSIPLPFRNTYRAEVVAAQADADEAFSRFDVARLRARAQLDEAAAVYAALRSAWMERSSTAVEGVAARADLLERLWQAGEISAADFLVQLKQGLDTELAMQALWARVWQAWFAYLAASGQLEWWLAVDTSTAMDAP